MSAEELGLPLLAATLDELAVIGPGSLPRWCGCVRGGKLTSSDISQAQTQDFELVHPNIYPIDKLLEYMMGLVQNSRISVT